MRCPVCEGAACCFFVIADGCEYWRCEDCLATFLRPNQLPLADTEQAQYRMHHNDPSNIGYRQFLNRIAALLLQRLPPAPRLRRPAFRVSAVQCVD